MKKVWNPARRWKQNAEKKKACGVVAGRQGASEGNLPCLNGEIGLKMQENKMPTFQQGRPTPDKGGGGNTSRKALTTHP